MTINSETRVAGPFEGNDATVAFPFSFKVFADTEVLVVSETASIESNLVLGSDYYVSLNADQNAAPGGTVVLTAPLATGTRLTVTSALEYLQPVDLTNQGGFYPRVINNAFDRLTILLQQLFERLGRALVFPISDGQVGEIPGAGQRAGSVLAFHEVTGDPVVGPSIADVNTVAGFIGNVNTVATNIADVNTVAGDIVNVNTVATNIAAVNNVSTNMADVNNVSLNMADVNAVADGLADVTNFADVYYGPSATDPATRRDGTPLQDGDLYFNTASSNLRAYNGTAWHESVTGSVTVQNLSGNGVATQFTLNYAPESEVITSVFVSGVYQQKNTYELGGVGGDVLIFSEAPPAGTDNIEVVVSSLTPSGDVLRADLAASGGAGLVGYSGGVTVSEFLDALQGAAPGEGADLIGYGSSDVKQALDGLQTIPANELLLVPSQFATIQAACAEVLKRRYDLNITVEVRLETGYQIPSGVDIRNCDLRNVRVTSVDVTVPLAAGFVGVAVSSDAFADGAIFYGENSYMPALACLIDAAGVGGPGYCVNQNSTGKVAGACGVMNAGKFGLYVANGSKCLATNSKFTGANWGNRVTTNSTLCAPQIDCSGAKLATYSGSNTTAAMDVSRGSVAYITGSPGAETNLTGSAGRGLAVRRSFVSATAVDTSNSGLDGLNATTGSFVSFATSKADNCGQDGISCAASWVDASGGVSAINAGRYGLLAQDGGKINARNAIATGAVTRGAAAVHGSDITLSGASCRQVSGVDGATDIFVSDGSIIHAAGATGGTNIAALTLNIAGLIFK